MALKPYLWTWTSPTPEFFDWLDRTEDKARNGNEPPDGYSPAQLTR
ncbi:hypothetical protein [Mycobacterium barrassiae]|nr:hypothetical protein [Mycobacterium barrassiae]